MKLTKMKLTKMKLTKMKLTKMKLTKMKLTKIKFTEMKFTLKLGCARYSTSEKFALTLSICLSLTLMPLG